MNLVFVFVLFISFFILSSQYFPKNTYSFTSFDSRFGGDFSYFIVQTSAHFVSIERQSIYVIKRGACKPWTFSIGGQCVAPGGPQSCRPRELAKRWVRRWAMLKPPLPSNWVNTIITCLKIIISKIISLSIIFIFSIHSPLQRRYWIYCF